MRAPPTVPGASLGEGGASAGRSARLSGSRRGCCEGSWCLPRGGWCERRVPGAPPGSRRERREPRRSRRSRRSLRRGRRGVDSGGGRDRGVEGGHGCWVPPETPGVGAGAARPTPVVGESDAAFSGTASALRDSGAGAGRPASDGWVSSGRGCRAHGRCTEMVLPVQRPVHGEGRRLGVPARCGGRSALRGWRRVGPMRRSVGDEGRQRRRLRR